MSGNLAVGTVVAAEGGRVTRIEKDDDEDIVSPFFGITKNAVLQEAKIFHERQLSSGKCSRVLTKILYLLNQGEVLQGAEATDVFFSVTKLFQSDDVHLRRLVYILIKEVAAKIDPDESLIVVSCLSKDMTSQTDLFRANAIRVLSKIMDPTMLAQIERFLKQALVDQNPFVMSSTLVAGQHLYKVAPDLVKRWVNEVQEAMTSSSRMAQYHALALLYQIKQQDQLSIQKVVTSLVRNPPKGALAQCLQIRIIAQVLRNNVTADNSELLQYLKDCLHNKNFMVMYEAARTMCKLEMLTAVQVAPAIGVLQEFLTSPVPTQRFAAVRTLSEVVTRYPLIVIPCSVDLEHLLTGRNRSIATLAITTLLKTGVESNVDRLLKSISGFMSDISDDFKVVLVDAIKALCLKFPHKHATLTSFLAGALREEGGYAYKNAIVEAILTICSEVKAAKETGLDHFCEFIEDCEFPSLSVKILYLLGEEGPRTSNPAKYIRFIFNRVILETASVRSAAVSALAKLGAAVPALTDNIIVLLKRCLSDNDDEVRDRAIFYVDVLQNNAAAKTVLCSSAPLPYRNLEYSLQVYLEQPPAASDPQPFSLGKHMLEVEDADEPAGDDEDTMQGEPLTAAARADLVPKTAGGVNPYLELLNSIPEFAALGALSKSCTRVDLTELESEYVVRCVKHLFPRHVVFQFNVTNNMEDQLLENVTVAMEVENEEEWTEEMVVPEATLKYGQMGTTFVCYSRNEESFNAGAIACTLKFTVRDVDVQSGDVDEGEGDEDEYQLEDLDVTESDFMLTDEVDEIGLVEFRRQWESLTSEREVMKKYSLALDSVQAAVTAVSGLLGMRACEGSGTVADGARSHAANLYGTFFPRQPVLCRAGFMLDAKSGVTLKVAVRCENAAICDILAACIR